MVKGIRVPVKLLIVLVKELPNIAVSQDIGGREDMNLTYGIIVVAKKVKQEKDAKNAFIGDHHYQHQFILGDKDKRKKAAKKSLTTWLRLKYWGPTTHIISTFCLATYEKELEEMKNMSRQEFVANLRRKSSGFSRGASMYRGVTRPVTQGIGSSSFCKTDMDMTEFNGFLAGTISMGGGKLGLEELQAIRICNLLLLAGFVDPKSHVAKVRPIDFQEDAKRAYQTTLEDVKSAYPNVEEANLPYLLHRSCVSTHVACRWLWDKDKDMDKDEGELEYKGRCSLLGFQLAERDIIVDYREKSYHKILKRLRRRQFADIKDDTSSLDSSDDEDSPRTLNFRAPLLCLCNPAYDVDDDDEIVYKSKK
ncbi:hypothetical protein Tco_1052056 [Tanacetum coccineum]